MCILNSSGTHPGAAVYEGPRDLQHVRVLFELQEVPLQLVLVAGHLAQLHLQPLKLLLNAATDRTPHLTRVFKTLVLSEAETQACTHHDLEDLSGGRSQWTLILLWNSYVGLLNLPEEVTCRHRKLLVCCKNDRCWGSEQLHTLKLRRHCRDATCAAEPARINISGASLPRILSISSHRLISLTKRRWKELTLGLS